MHPAMPVSKPRRTWWKSKPAVGLACLFVGGVLGVAGADMDPEEAPAFIALQERKNDVELDLQNVTAERDDLAAEVFNLTERLDREVIQAKQLADRSDELEADVLQCTAREVELVTLEDELSARESDLVEREEAVKEKEAAAEVIAPLVSTAGSGSSGGGASPTPAATKPATAKPPAPKQTQAPSSVYYKNCSAARAAGVAPIYRGEAGYAKHLDRDGDGIACE